MNIQTTTSVTLALNLSEEDARAILVDPRPFQNELRQALAGAHTNGNSHTPKAGNPLRGRAA